APASARRGRRVPRRRGSDGTAAARIRRARVDALRRGPWPDQHAHRARARLLLHHHARGNPAPLAPRPARPPHAGRTTFRLGPPTTPAGGPGTLPAAVLTPSRDGHDPRYLGILPRRGGEPGARRRDRRRRAGGTVYAQAARRELSRPRRALLPPGRRRRARRGRLRRLLR